MLYLLFFIQCQIKICSPSFFKNIFQLFMNYPIFAEFNYIRAFFAFMTKSYCRYTGSLLPIIRHSLNKLSLDRSACAKSCLEILRKGAPVPCGCSWSYRICSIISRTSIVRIKSIKIPSPDIKFVLPDPFSPYTTAKDLYELVPLLKSKVTSLKE